VERAVADPEFQAKAVQFFSPLRYLAPAQYEALVRDADVQYRALWKEMPWADKEVLWGPLIRIPPFLLVRAHGVIE
jgi:hypothetical protein